MVERMDLKEQVAWACRILAMAGHDDLTLGHVSGRHPGDRVFYMKRSGLGLGEVTPKDVLLVDLDGNKVEGTGKVHVEVPLHTEVYRTRPDVGAVIHTHPPYSIAISATFARLEALSHDAVMFPDGVPVFEDTAELIASRPQGEAVAAALGSGRALLLRNHGVLVVGKDVRWAVVTALILERAAMIQHIAASLGPLRPIPPEAVSSMHPDKYRDEFMADYWEYLIRQVRRRGLDHGMPEGAHAS
jgi:L-ribulose-5-phosphate 4-epimerase